jgi:hypothetical protein
MGLLLDLLVFQDHILLNLKHLFAVALNSDQFIIRLRLLDLEEYLKNLVILILHVDETQLLFLILADKADKLATLLNLVQALHELVGEVFNPLDVLVFDLDQRVPDAFLPFADDGDVWLVFNDRFRGIRLDLLKLFQLVLVLLVNVVQVFRRNDTLQALVFLLCLRVEGSRRVMRRTIDSQCALWVDFLGLIEERVVDDRLANVTFHVGAGLFLRNGIDQALDDLECSWIVRSGT